MATIQPTTGTPSAAGVSSPSAPGALGKDDFLKLLVGQLKHQDPMNPTGDQDFMGQMAQFSMLEQLSNMAQATEELGKRTEAAHTVSLLGRTVTYEGEDGVVVSGTVDGVALDDDGATISVGGRAGIDPSAISHIR